MSANPLLDALRRVPGGMKPWMTATPAPTKPPMRPQPPGGEGKPGSGPGDGTKPNNAPQGKQTPPIVPGSKRPPRVTIHSSRR